MSKSENKSGSTATVYNLPLI